ncbi:MAG: thermonuclease family protein [Dongiaceae bacterium]
MARPLHLLLALGLSTALLAARWTPERERALEPALEKAHSGAVTGVAAESSMRKAGLLTVLGALGLVAIVGKYQLEGPVAAEVVRVVDGDTLTVRAQIWIGQELTTNVRLSGVNAPELSGSCDRERALAQAAKAFLAERVEGRPVTLRKIGLDKFGGRVVAVVEDAAGDLAVALLAARLAVPYDGGARGSWCE